MGDMATALRNDGESYGWVAIGLHWLMAVAIVGLFCLGLWMVGLGYYDEWYHRAPAIHKAVGILVGVALLLRLTWRAVNERPRLLGKAWERTAASVAHRVFYVLMLAMVATGYLISTEKGAAVEVFGLFSVPALPWRFDNQADVAGEVHEWLAWTLILLAAGHALVALKHHFVDRDATLRRMLGLGR